MDELFAYAVLLYAGFPVEKEYEDRLNTIFLEHPDDRELLELECCKTIGETLHIFWNHTDFQKTLLEQYEVFGRLLMRFLKHEYERTDLVIFSRRAYDVWHCLPEYMQFEYPFLTLNSLEDMWIYRDKEKVRKACAEMLQYYE